jgi:hypothetical protein
MTARWGASGPGARRTGIPFPLDVLEPCVRWLIEQHIFPAITHQVRRLSPPSAGTFERLAAMISGMFARVRFAFGVFGFHEVAAPAI